MFNTPYFNFQPGIKQVWVLRLITNSGKKTEFTGEH